MVRVMQPPILTDAKALARNRARASVFFLHEAMADEAQDRLTEVNRAFTTPAIVTPFPDIWASRLPNARIVADDDVLDLTPGAHDLVIHAMGLHWANDPLGQIIQCRRALVPDGMFLGALLGGQTLSELRACLAEAEAMVTGGLSPRVVPMAEIRDLGGLLQRSGLALPVADAVTLRVSYQSALHLMHDLRAMGEGNALAGRLRQFSRRAIIERAAEIYAINYPDTQGRVSATYETIFLTGWAPDDSQPKPLRPGSASQRLAAALGTSETPLGD